MTHTTRSVALGLALLLLVLAGFGGCAYYNTFYNAKKYFNEGEDLGRDVDPRNQPTGSQKSKYNTAIAKCELVLDEYPDSDLVDDALFLMGKAQLRLREYRKALRNFDNVLVNFPNSDYREETLYLKSLAHLAVREEQNALDNFRLLRGDYPDGRFGVEAVYRLGDAHAENEDFEHAVPYYEEYLEQFPDHEARQGVILRLGQAYIELERYEDAVRTLELIDERKASRRELFEARFSRVSALSKLGRSEEAAELLATLDGDSEAENKRGEAMVLEGEIQLALGEEEAGLQTLERAALDFEGKEIEGQARYLIAEHLRRARGPRDESVLDQLQTAIEHRVSGEYATLIQERRQQLDLLDRLQQQHDEGDSLAYRAAFRLGELLLLELERPAEAIGYYEQVIAEAPESLLAPRAAYAIGYIHESRLDAPDSARVAFDRLRELYPDSPQARSLDGEVFLDAKPPELALFDEGVSLGGGAPASGGGGVEPAGGEAGLRSGRRPLRRGGPGARLPRGGP